MPSYRDVIAETILARMEADPSVVVMGCGVADPKGIFGTTLPARERFPDRVIETPLSENMLTGALTGMAINGYKPIFVHARADFLTLSAEHLVNTASKWRWLHDQPVPITVRAIIGEGWGQGPTHSQTLAHMFASVPGLDVFLPASITGLRRAYANAAATGKPTVVIEHRRLYDQEAVLDGVCYEYGPDFSPGPYLLGVSASWLDARQAGLVLSRAYKLEPHADAIERVEDWPARAHGGWEHGIVLACPDRGLADMLEARFWRQAHKYGWKTAGLRVLTPPATPCPAGYEGEQAWYASFGVKAIVRAACELMGREPPDVDSDVFATGEAF